MRFKIVDEAALNEVRAEDDLYYQGVFWVIAKSFEDILDGNYKILSEKFVVDYNGNLQQEFNKDNWTHEHIWNNKYRKDYGDVPYNYYPRGRVVVKNGSYWLNLPSEIYLPDIIDSIVDDFKIGKLKSNTSIKKSSTGAHYTFLLK